MACMTCRSPRTSIQRLSLPRLQPEEQAALASAPHASWPRINGLLLTCSARGGVPLLVAATQEHWMVWLLLGE